MTTKLLNISKIKIGTSAEYPVLRVQQDHRRVGPADQARESYEEITWTLSCLAKASGPTTIRAFNDTLRSTLARRGVDVVLTERGQSTSLLAAGSLPGYPETQWLATPDIAFGEWQSFDLRVTDRRPIADEDDVVEHTYTITTTTDKDGGVETRRAGEVRLANGENAAAWVASEVLAPAASDAASNDLAFTKRVEVNSDAAWCRYEYTTAPDTSSGGITGLSQASVEDRTSRDTAGNGRRVISGYATGANATTWAESQLLSPVPNGTVLVGREGPTPPSVPDGRVSFRYEYAVGVQHTDFPGIYVLGLEETLTGPITGGHSIVAAEYMGADPTLRRTEKRAYLYRQSSTIRFLGSTHNSHNLTALLSEDNLTGPPLITKRSEGPIRIVSVEREYAFATPATLPNPRSLAVLS